MNNLENKESCINCPNADKMPVLGFIIVGAGALTSLIILVLWIRYLYHNGSPRK